MADLEQHIFEKLETYKDLFDNAHDLIHVVEPDGRIAYVNSAWRRVLGFSEHEVKGKSIYSFIHPSDKDRFIKYRTDIVNGTGNHAEIVVGIMTKTKSVVYIEGFVSPKVLEGKTIYTRGIFRDITVRLQNEAQLKLAHEQLKEREANLNQLLYHAPDAVVVVDTESKIKYWNPKAEQIFGWTIGEVLGKSLTEVIIPVQHREMHRVGMKRYLATGEERVLNRTVEITALNKANREFYVALTISATIQNGQPAFIAFIRDIDEQKKNVKELEDKRMQLERSNQQLEQFAHTASHDMKEPIRKILMFTDRVQTDSGNVLTSDSTGYIAKIRTAASRLAEMVDGVLKYASLKGGDMVIEYVELNDVIKNVEADLELLLQQKNAVVKYADMPSLYCAPFMIHQLFYNLINNSLKFSKPEVNPVINISATKISSMQTKEYGLDDSTPHIEVIVEDNGIGFPQEYAETIFKTFARLNPQSKFEGTGLGLSLCKAIVEKHGGIIKANGAENVGAKFTIVLPEFQNEG